MQDKGKNIFHCRVMADRTSSPNTTRQDKIDKTLHDKNDKVQVQKDDTTQQDMMDFRKSANNRSIWLWSNSSVEVRSFENKKIILWFDDATLECNGPGRVDVITCDHPHCYSGPLALDYGLWYLCKKTHQNIT